MFVIGNGQTPLDGISTIYIPIFNTTNITYPYSDPQLTNRLFWTAAMLGTSMCIFVNSGANSTYRRDTEQDIPYTSPLTFVWGSLENKSVGKTSLASIAITPALWYKKQCYYATAVTNSETPRYLLNIHYYSNSIYCAIYNPFSSTKTIANIKYFMLGV